MGLMDKLNRFTRRLWTGTPSSVTPDAHVAYLQEQVQAYATAQPYTSPLNSADNLTGETWEIRQAYRRLLKESAVAAPLLAKTFAVCSQDPQVMADDKADPVHRDAAKWVDWAITRSAGGWAGGLMEVAFPGQMDGFAVVEKVWGVAPADHPKYPGWWTLAALKSKDTQFVRLKTDQYKNVVAIQAMAAGQGGRSFDPRDFILFTHLKIFQSPFGLSVMRPAYRAAFMIEAAVKLRSILLENFSGPYLVAKYNQGDKAAETQLRSIMSQARARGWITIPRESEVQVLNLATSAPDQFQNTIEDLRKEISSAMRGGYLQSMESKTPQGDSKTHKNETTLFDWYLSAILCQTFTEQLVPDLVEPAFGRRGGRPAIGLGGLDIASALQELAKFKAAQDLGLDLSLAQVVEVVGIESPRDPADRLPAPAKNGPPGGGLPGGPPGDPPPAPGGDDPLQFADAAGLLVFADGTKFTGRITDSLGRGRCYEAGRQVRCPEGNDDSARAASRERTGDLLDRTGREPLSRTEAKELGDRLWQMTVPELKAFEARFMSGGAGRRVKEERINKLIAWAGVPYTRPANVRTARERRLDNLDMGMLGGGTSSPGAPTRTRVDAQETLNRRDAARRQQTRSPLTPPDPTTGPPKPVVPRSWEVTRGAVTAAKALFGEAADVSDPNGGFARTLAAASTGLDGAKVGVRAAAGTLSVSTTAPGLKATRTFVREDNGDVTGYMEYFRLDKADLPIQHRGVTGLDLFTNSVKGMRALGVKKLKVYAAGDAHSAANDGYNGYYTWPRFGYDGPIPERRLDSIPADLRSGMGNRTNIQALFEQPGGSDWWKANGVGLDLEFDLSDNSPNMKLLAAYATKRAANPRGDS